MASYIALHRAVRYFDEHAYTCMLDVSDMRATYANTVEHEHARLFKIISTVYCLKVLVSAFDARKHAQCAVCGIRDHGTVTAPI